MDPFKKSWPTWLQIVAVILVLCLFLLIPTNVNLAMPPKLLGGILSLVLLFGIDLAWKTYCRRP